MGLEVKVRKGERLSVLTEDGYELFVELTDVSYNRIKLEFSGPNHFSVTRISRGYEPKQSESHKLGDEASHGSYLRRIIEQNKKREGE